MSGSDTPVLPETADIETSSDGYAARFSSPAGQWMLSVQERVALELLAGQADATVLDVGGGHGQLAAPLCRNGYRVTVLGSDDSCRHRIADLVESGRCGFVTGNVVGLPFPDRSFDITLSIRLVTHCVHWQELIGELCRTASRAVIIDYPTSQSLNRISPALFGAKKRIEKNTRAWRLFTHAEIRDAFERHGFRVEARRGQFFLPMVLHRVLRCPRLSAALEALCGAVGLTRRYGSPVLLKATRTPAHA